MGIPVLILGESGSGKSTSMRNFEENEILVFNVANKPLPFKKKLLSTNFKTKSGNIASNKYNFFQKMAESKAKENIKTMVIDDSQYLMAFELFDRAKEMGYTKFTDVALNFRNLIDFIINQLPDDTIVYFLHHTETNAQGKTKAKTSGQMLDNQLTLEGLFTIVLMAKTDGKRYYFETQSDGFNTCKSPMEMFASFEIDNDLKMVDNAIREYWELGGK